MIVKGQFWQTSLLILLILAPLGFTFVEKPSSDKSKIFCNSLSRNFTRLGHVNIQVLKDRLTVLNAKKMSIDVRVPF